MSKEILPQQPPESSRDLVDETWEQHFAIQERAASKARSEAIVANAKARVAAENEARRELRAEERKKDELRLNRQRRLATIGLIASATAFAIGAGSAYGQKSLHDKNNQPTPPTPQAEIAEVISNHIEDPEQYPLPDDAETFFVEIGENGSTIGAARTVIDKSYRDGKIDSDERSHSEGIVLITGRDYDTKYGPPQPGDSIEVALGDFNGDGQDEVVVTGRQPNATE